MPHRHGQNITTTRFFGKIELNSMDRVRASHSGVLAPSAIGLDGGLLCAKEMFVQ